MFGEDWPILVNIHISDYKLLYPNSYLNVFKAVPEYLPIEKSLSSQKKPNPAEWD